MNYIVALWAMFTSLVAGISALGWWREYNHHSQHLLRDRLSIMQLEQEKADTQERQTVEVDAVIPTPPKRNSKGQFVKKVTSDESSQ